MEIKDLVHDAHANAVAHGFYDEKKDIATRLMLIVTEISEACEADRKNKHSGKDAVKWYIDNEGYLLDGESERGFEMFIKDTFEDELADAVIRIADLCGYLNIDLETYIQAKMQYNKNRPYKHGKEY